MPQQHRRHGRSKQLSGSDLPLAALRVNEVATVRELQTHDPAIAQKLLALGVIPGARVRVVQRFPAYVLQIGFSQIAIDHQIARAVRVQLESEPDGAE
ncbi:MAG: FeoA family protein [Armatimonadota bacterium]|nr:FeoA family protein [Armatimonadota bacterium]